MAAQEWSNWSGSLRFIPDVLEKPHSEIDVVKLVLDAAKAQRTIRVVGAGHSSSPLVKTDDVLLSLEHLQDVEAVDQERCEITIGTGLTVHDAGQTFLKHGLSMHNTGDVDVQTLAGAIGTGTHGTGRTLQNLSAVLVGVRLVKADGEVVHYTAHEHPEILRAARVALGTLGIFTTITLRLLPAFKLHRREWCTHIDLCMENLDALIAQNRNFDFYWYPRSDYAKLRIMNLPGDGMSDLPYATCVKEMEGWAADILPRERTLKFDEMEYALPIEAGPECFREVRQRIKTRHRKTVAWRVLYRTIAADDTYLSPYYGRDSVTISLHQNAGLPYQGYFDDIEPIFRAYGGRPHWGKKHSLTASQLRDLYPMWDRFMDICQQHDPQGVFMTPYLRRLLSGEEPSL